MAAAGSADAASREGAEIELRVKGSGGVKRADGRVLEVSVSVPSEAADGVARVWAAVAAAAGAPAGTPYRLLAQGRVLSPEKGSLAAQGVRRSGVRCLAMKARAEAAAAAVAEAAEAKLEATRVERLTQAALRLAARDATLADDRTMAFQLEDQDGRAVDLPEEEQRALKNAMVLSERGAAFMRDGEYPAALQLLRESDRLFKTVTPALLDAIDNYATLQLNLVWCFLRTRDASFLDEAKERLAQVEANLERAHGTDLSRLLAVRGATTPTLVLYLRLHLCRAVVLFYTNHRSDARQALDAAADLLKELAVAPEDVVALAGMGFTDDEARLGLRAARTVEHAAAYLLTVKEKRDATRAAERARQALERRQRRYGNTADGTPLDLAKLDALHREMGFEKRLVAEALRQTNNSDQGSLDLLTTNPDLLRAALASGGGGASGSDGGGGGGGGDGHSAAAEVALRAKRSAALGALVAMGYAAELALGALRAAGGGDLTNADAAAALLLEGRAQAVTADELATFLQQQQQPQEDADAAASATAATAAASSPAAASSSSSSVDAALAAQLAAGLAADDGDEEDKEETAEERQAREDEEFLVENLSFDDYVFSDSTLEEEQALLVEFRTALGLTPTGQVAPGGGASAASAAGAGAGSGPDTGGST